MVIFGAGASHDSSPYNLPDPDRAIESRLPVANDLFADHGLYRSCREQFPEFYDVIAELIPKKGRSIEVAMQRLQDEETRNKRRRPQLTAVRYYLQSLFTEIT